MTETQVYTTEDGAVAKSIHQTSKPTFRYTQYLTTLIVNISSFSYGTVIGWPSPTEPQLTSINSPIETVTDFTASSIGSFVPLGAVISTALYSYLVEKIGRKMTCYLVAIPLIIAWLLKYFFKSSVNLLVARFIMGVSSGGVVVLVPIYVADIAQDDIRGTLGSFFVFFINFGVLFAYTVGSYVSYFPFIIICLIFPLIFLVGSFFISDSPVYLLKNGRVDEAFDALEWYREGSGKNVQSELQKMTNLMSETGPTAKPSLKELLSSKATRKALLIGVLMVLNQQLCGIFAVLSFTVTIFKKAGSDLSPNIATIIVGAIQLIGSYVATVLVDRAGRKILFIVSDIAMGIFLGIFSIYFLLDSSDVDVSSVSFLPILCICGFIFFYAIGLCPIPFVVISEIFAPQAQSLAATVCMTILWFTAVLVAQLYSPAANLVGESGVYAFFSVCCFIGGILAILYLTETKNRSLESIIKELEGEKPRPQWSIGTSTNEVTTF